MLTKTRKHRRNSRNKKIKIIFSFLLISLIMIAGTVIYLNSSKKPIFISPLPVSYQLNFELDSDQDLSLIKKLLKEKDIEYAGVTRTGRNYVLNLKDKSKVIISTDKDLSAQIASLQFILTRLTMESRRFSELDLRFDKPVIR